MSEICIHEDLKLADGGKAIVCALCSKRWATPSHRPAGAEQVRTAYDAQDWADGCCAAGDLATNLGDKEAALSDWELESVYFELRDHLLDGGLIH